MAGAILKTFLLPLVAGMLVRAVAPALAGRIDDILLRVASLVMLACALVRTRVPAGTEEASPES